MKNEEPFLYWVTFMPSLPQVKSFEVSHLGLLSLSLVAFVHTQIFF